MTAGFQPPGYPTSRRPINPVILMGAALLGLVLLGGGLACVLGMGPFARTSANSPGPASTPGPTAPQTLDGATDLPIQRPSSDVVPSPTVQLTPGPPNDDTERLLTHVPEAVRGSCVPGAFAEPVLARVDCTPSDDISVYYALYENLADTTDAYDGAFGRAQIDRESGLCYTQNDDGSLSATSDHWPSEHQYTQQQKPIGRYLCDIDGLPMITWTDDRLYILAVATSPTGDSDQLVSFWALEAGPIP